MGGLVPERTMDTQICGCPSSLYKIEYIDAYSQLSASADSQPQLKTVQAFIEK